ncbi:MAG: DUF4157 domain-containing protein [Anaerolineae bacterium]
MLAEPQVSREELRQTIMGRRGVSADSLLALQRMVGNRAVRRLIQRQLTVGAAHDAYEQEADRVADQVLSAPAAHVGTTLAVQRAGEEEEEVQTKRVDPMGSLASSHRDRQSGVTGNHDANSPFEPGGDFQQRLDATSGGGSPLPGETREFMESRFGADFGGVRVHIGGESAQLNREVSAQAFTHGQNIYLGDGKTDLQSGEGKRLLAHELTHVVQQTGAAHRLAIETAPLQRAFFVQRLVSDTAFKVFTKDLDRRTYPVLDTIDTQLGLYKVSVAVIPQTEAERKDQFKILHKIEEEIYKAFDAAPKKGADAPWKKQLYWLLDDIHLEFNNKIAQGGKLYAADQDTMGGTAVKEMDDDWDKLVKGTGSVTVSNVGNDQKALETTEPGFKTEVLSAFARLMSKPKGRELVHKILTEGGPGAKSIGFRPLLRSNAESGVIAAAGAKDEALAINKSKSVTPTGTGTGIKLPAGYRDTDVRTHDTAGDETLAPMFVMLAHELIHALHNLRGTNQKETEYTEHDPKHIWEHLEEEQTISTGTEITENMVRGEHGLTARHGHTHTNKVDKQNRAKRIKEREEQNIEVFLAEEVMKLQDFVPSTKSGMFDVELNPAGKTLKVIVKLHLDLIALKTSKLDESWGGGEAQAWVLKLQTNLGTAWNNKAQFKLERPNAPKPDLVLKPTFEIAASYSMHEQLKPVGMAGTPSVDSANIGQIGPGGAHFKTTVYRGQGGAKGNYNTSGASGEFQSLGSKDPKYLLAANAKKDSAADSKLITAHAMDPLKPSGRGLARLHHEDAEFDNHNAHRLQQITESERNVLRAFIGNDGFDINFKFKVKGLGAIGDRSTVRLNQFAEALKGLYPKLALSHPLVIKGPAAKTQKVETHLRQYAAFNDNFPTVKNRIEHLAQGRQTKLYVKPGWMATKADNVGSQMTAAHEFGHMLGLPDDYVGLYRDVDKGTGTPKPRDVEHRMSDYSFKDPSKGLDVQMTKEVHEKVKKAVTPGTEDVPFTPEKQASMLNLAQKANVPVPTTFGIFHDTIMGSGDQFLPHHFVTVWDAVTKLTERWTKPEWWKIDV